MIEPIGDNRHRHHRRSKRTPNLSLQLVPRGTNKVLVASVVVAATLVVPGLVQTASAQTSQPLPTIMQAAHYDTSKPLRSMQAPAVRGPGPHPYFAPQSADRRPAQVGKPTVPPTTNDPTVTPSVTSLTPLQSFEGVGQTGGAPADPNMAVGLTQVVDQVNSSMQIFNKSGQSLLGPVTNQLWWSGFGGPCETQSGSDGIVRYDTLAGRWVVSKISGDGTTGNYYCIAVSQTTDATGGYNRYSFAYGSLLPDYPKLGIWPDGYYMTNKLIGGAYYTAQVCVMNRSAMLAGTAAGAQCFFTGNTYYVLMPSDLDGINQPPAGEPNTLMSIDQASSTSLNYWKLHVDWTSPSNSTLTGPTAVSVAAFTPACPGTGVCVPQPNTTQKLAAISDTLMFRLAYRNFGDHESLVVDHSVDVSGTPGVRWYELRIGTGGALSAYQQGTYAPDSTARWMGSIAQDKVGNIGLGFSASSTSINPSVGFTGRLASDPLGQMPQGEGVIQAGGGYQNFDRWGDYSSMNIDPIDGCTFWYTNQYLTTNAGSWHTRLGSFQLPGCALRNPGFETGTLANWVTGGVASSVTSSGVHGGSYAAVAGSTSPTNGDSSVEQAFQVPVGAHTLSFWYNVICPDTLTYDWATATLRDTTNSTTTTPLAKTCTNDNVWRQVSVPVVGGHWYDLTLTSHDDNYTGDATYTKYDDVTIT